MKIYTKTGDDGTTSLFDGTRVPKTHPRVVAYGAVDELNAHLGAAIAAGLDAAVAVEDADALRAARDLAALGVAAGPCGAASLAAARVALTGPDAAPRRAHLGIDSDSTVVLVSTEGAEANPLPEA